MGRPTVLVVGDWLVDEHWVVGEHRSDSSSRPGLRHTRALHTANCSVRALCGAGQVATILYNATTGSKHLFEVLGLGIWHRADEDELQFMLDPKNNEGNNPHRLIPVSRASQDLMARVRLVNLAGPLLSDQVGTTRVLRVYEQKRPGVELRDRLDWELRLSQGLRAQLEREGAKQIGTISKLSQTDRVVVKDLGKGVVTTRVIEALRAIAAEAEWFVSSKAWRPGWYSALPADRVRVLLIPQLAARKAVESDRVPLSTWITVGDRASKEALDEMSALAAMFPNAHVLALPEGMAVLAREQHAGDDGIGLKQTATQDSQRLKVVPMASVFFPALLSELHYRKGLLKICIERALSFTEEWTRQEYRRVLDDNWRPTDKQNLNVEGDGEYEQHYEVEAFGWESALRHWDNARASHGIVFYRTVEAKLQLWRAMTEVRGYISLVPSKRFVLQTLVRHGLEFKRGPRRSMAFMLIDRPGAGKSYLVECLAKHLGMRILAFNITQMLTRHDLMACFDKIATTQAQSRDENLLVFVDEVNAPLDGQHVYDAFLAPLEDSIYVRSGNTFHISPCFWVFAGTDRPRAHDGSDGLPDKGSDFESRLTKPPLSLRVSDDESNAARVEKIYVGAAALQRCFPDVRRVSQKVLGAFDILPETITAREIAQLAKGFRNVQYGMVTSANLPANWHLERKVPRDKFEEWNKGTIADEEKNLVSLESTPDDDLLRAAAPETRSSVVKARQSNRKGKRKARIRKRSKGHRSASRREVAL